MFCRSSLAFIHLSSQVKNRCAIPGGLHDRSDKSKWSKDQRSCSKWCKVVRTLCALLCRPACMQVADRIRRRTNVTSLHRDRWYAHPLTLIDWVADRQTANKTCVYPPTDPLTHPSPSRWLTGYCTGDSDAAANQSRHKRGGGVDCTTTLIVQSIFLVWRHTVRSLIWSAKSLADVV